MEKGRKRNQEKNERVKSNGSKGRAFYMETKQEFLDHIKEFNPNYDLHLIAKAFDVAAEMHEGQLRRSGEKYLIHPLEVAKILAGLGMDEETIVAGLLHDVIEDTSYTDDANRRIRRADYVDGRGSHKAGFPEV